MATKFRSKDSLKKIVNNNINRIYKTDTVK